MSYRRYHHDPTGGHRFYDTGALPSLPPDRDLSEGLLKTPLMTLEKPTEMIGQDITISDFRYIGSYNWINSTKPTIIVPGSPPIWRDRQLPFKVARDSGLCFVDQNSYRMPSSALYPLLRAVDIVSEENGDGVDWSTVDFVTDRNGLRKLLRWINDLDDSAKEFRIDTQLAGKRTVLFNRWEKRTREGPSGGFGFNFERENTTKAPGCELSTGHHRIVQYDFDGLTMVVRFEVDACLQSESTRNTSTTATTTADVDSLLDMFSSLNVSTTPRAASDTRSSVSTSELSVIRAGSQVPQDAIVEMATRSRRNAEEFDWENAYPQLYLSQTPHYFFAVHNRGTFEKVSKSRLDGPELRRIDRRLQDSFRRLRQVLETIQELVIEHGQQGRLSLVHQGGTLRVFERKSQESCLPDSVLSRFDV